MADIFDEIGEDLRAERMQALLRRYGGLLLVVMVLVVAGVAGWQWWRGQQGRRAEGYATEYLDASRKAGAPALADGTTPGQAVAATDFEALAQQAPEGYRVLAELRAAGLRAAGNDLPGALGVWDKVAGDAAADPLLRDLANLLWAQHQVDHGDAAAVESRLAPLVAYGNAWSPLAREQQALLAIRTGQQGRARDILKQLQEDQNAPDGVRGRAAGILGLLGDATPAAAPAAGAGG